VGNSPLGEEELSKAELSVASVKKGKRKESHRRKKEKHTKAPNLGVEVGNLKRPERNDKARCARRHFSSQFDASHIKQTPSRFGTRGYSELMHGDNSWWRSVAPSEQTPQQASENSPIQSNDLQDQNSCSPAS
jgi:hypothetical protein